MKLLKVTGAGNDFLILDLRKTDGAANGHSGMERMKVAQAVCHRTNGIGADGFLVLEPSSQADFRWDFYNADGSNAEMCGNAARCVVLVTSKGDTPPVTIETRAGIIEGRVLADGQVEVQMPEVKDSQFQQSEAVLGTQLQFDFVNSGVPHAVVGLPSGRKFEEFGAAARALRSHPRFAAAGTNVTFYQPIGDAHISVQTFERGVEDFTLACGTGAVAAAIVAFHRQPQLKSITVKMPGGTLQVVNGIRPLLIGPARVIAKIEWLG